MQEKKLRIAIIIPSLLKGGAERLTFDVASILSRRSDVDVKLITLREGNSYGMLNPELPVIEIPSSVTPSVIGEWKRNTDSLDKFLREFNPHVIHSHLFEAEMVSRDRILPQVAYFTHLHDNMPQFLKPELQTFCDKKKLTNLYERQWMLKQYRKCNNSFIAISRDAESYFQENLPSDLQDIHLLNNAIDYKRFFREHPAPLDPECISMATTGSLVDKKNQAFLVDVVTALNQKGKKAKLYVLGDGPNRSKIEDLICKRNLQNQIIMEGNVDYVEKYLHQVNFYVHPATYEPFGLAILEAMAASLACVVLDGKGNRDIHIEGKNGIMIHQQNAGEFADALIHLHSNPSTYSEICRFSNKFAEHYDINVYVNRMLSIFREKLSASL